MAEKTENFLCEKCEKWVILEEKTEMFQVFYLCPNCKAKYGREKVFKKKEQPDDNSGGTS